MTNTRTVRVHYQIATYEGVVTLRVSEDADRDAIIARVKNQLRRLAGGSLPFGYERFRVEEAE